MRSAAITPGDLVLVSRKGRVFHAKVRGLDASGGFVVDPIERGISYRHVGARDIVDHWRHAGSSPEPQRRPRDQLDFNEFIA